MAGDRAANQAPMTVVVDIGCATQPRVGSEGYDESVPQLIERFHPYTLYGFDPHPVIQEGTTEFGGTRVVLTRKAAWTYDGEVMYVVDGIRSAIDTIAPRTEDEMFDARAVRVPCFDLARWLDGRHVVLKLDVEGAEYVLLEHLIATGSIVFVDQLLVEWHPLGDDWKQRRANILTSVPCPTADW